MRKKLFLWMAALTFGFAIVSCSSSNDASSTDSGTNPSTSDNTTADYTIIFWGMSGACDNADCVDMATLASHYQKGLIGKNVNIAGLMKTSVSKYDARQSPTVDKTMYFDSKSIGTKEISKDEMTFKSDITGKEVKQIYDDAFSVLNGREYSDTDYPLNNVDSLATFIKRTAEKFPARHYVLMTFGHGGGFSPVVDTPTKASVYDSFRKNVALSADDIVSAVNKSGVKIQTYFTHSCLMASLENMAAFSQVFDYAFLSAEVTASFYFPEYMAKLTQAGDDEAKMKEKSRELIDYYAKLYDGNTYTSHGFYDLKQTSNLLSIVKEAADWYAENYTIGDSIQDAIENSVICINFGDKNNDATQTELLRSARAGVRSLLRGESSVSNVDEMMNAVGGIYDLMAKSSNFTYGYVMADVLRNTVKTNNFMDNIVKLKDIYNRYMTTLKNMAYIGMSNKPAKADADYAYTYASPTVNIFAMNSEYYIPIPSEERAIALMQQIMDSAGSDADAFTTAGHKLLDGTPFANFATLDIVKSNYTSSVFDKKVGWSKFLEKIQFNPSVVVNPDRWLVNDNMK